MISSITLDIKMVFILIKEIEKLYIEKNYDRISDFLSRMRLFAKQQALIEGRDFDDSHFNSLKPNDLLLDYLKILKQRLGIYRFSIQKPENRLVTNFHIPNDISSIDNNLSFKLTFPFDKRNKITPLMNDIYTCIYTILEKISTESALIHLTKPYDLYHPSIDAILCNNKVSEELDYPRIELFYKNKPMNINTVNGCISFNVLEPIVSFQCKNNLFYFKKQKLFIPKYKKKPPCLLNELCIYVSGKFKFDFLPY